MTLTNLRDISDEETNRDRARAVTETYLGKPDELIDSSPDPIPQKKRLDVDAVLRRSLPRLTAEDL